jgi:hypothetical protein
MFCTNKFYNIVSVSLKAKQVIHKYTHSLNIRFWSEVKSPVTLRTESKSTII